MGVSCQMYKYLTPQISLTMPVHTYETLFSVGTSRVNAQKQLIVPNMILNDPIVPTAGHFLVELLSSPHSPTSITSNSATLVKTLHLTEQIIPKPIKNFLRPVSRSPRQVYHKIHNFSLVLLKDESITTCQSCIHSHCGCSVTQEMMASYKCSIYGSKRRFTNDQLIVLYCS